VFDSGTKRWPLRFNQRRRRNQQIGLVIHEGEDLRFPKTPTATGLLRTEQNVSTDILTRYAERFNPLDGELHIQHIPKATA
jgi:hypothetical protein